MDQNIEDSVGILSDMKSGSEGEPKTESCRTCRFYVKRKKRFCRMLVKPGLRYCGQHLVEEEDSSHRKRIPCPLDPNHSCFEDYLEKHLLKCNAKEVTGLPYVKRNINQIRDVQEEPTRSMLSTLSDEELLAFIAKVEKIYQEHVGTIKESVLSHSALEEEMKTPGYGMSVLRHLEQNASLLGHLEKCNLLDTDSKSTCYIEFGAGRGQQTHWLTESVTDTRNALFVLVDRGSQRYKFDAKLKYREDLSLSRIRVDIQHLDLSSVEGIKSYSCVVGIGKHLCGSATDLTLSCLSKLSEPPVAGIIIALCCHHRCAWASYSGLAFLKECGFLPEEFYTLTALTSWATCSSRDVGLRGDVIGESDHSVLDKDTEDNQSNAEERRILENRYTRLSLSAQYREEVGRKAKNVLNYGRVKFLESCGFKCQLVQYVSKEKTLENVALLAEANDK